MSRDRRTIWMICVTLAVAAASTVAPAALAGSHALRLPAADADAVYSLGVRPLHDLDYGSFRWLVVDDISLDRIEAAGVPHDKVEDATTVQVQGFVFDPVADGEPAIPDGLRASGDRAGLHLLQLIGPVRDEWVAALAEAGIQLLQYYPHNAYLVWADPDTMAGLEALPFVRWQGRFHPAYKINESLEGRGGDIGGERAGFGRSHGCGGVALELPDGVRTFHGKTMPLRPEGCQAGRSATRRVPLAFASTQNRAVMRAMLGSPGEAK